MESKMKDLYGRRITPGVKIFILVVIVLLGLGLAFTDARHGHHKNADKMIVE
jgi:hypothetical protein